MNGATAQILLIIVCAALVVLRLAGVVTSLMAGIVFAAALAVLGILSSGYRR